MGTRFAKEYKLLITTAHSVKSTSRMLKAFLIYYIKEAIVRIPPAFTIQRFGAGKLSLNCASIHINKYS